MGLKQLWMIVIYTLVLTNCHQSQGCSSLTDITESYMELLINTTGIPCVQCLDSKGQTSSGTIFIRRGIIVEDNSVPGLTVDSNGVLVILDPANLVPDGFRSPLIIDCLFSLINPTFFHQHTRLYSKNIVPPYLYPVWLERPDQFVPIDPATSRPASLTLREGTDAVVLCFNGNPRPLTMVTEHWLGPNGLVAAESEFNILDFQNISRAQAGEYMCILTANTNQTASATLTVVVDYSPIEPPDCTVNGSLYFVLRGVRYESGSTITIIDVGEIDDETGNANPDTSLVCVTSEVNMQQDGRYRGEWYFPNGSIVFHNRYMYNRDLDFTRSDYAQQVRLNRQNDAIVPTGIFTCRVPGEVREECEDIMHIANITLELPVAREVVSYCYGLQLITVWSPPPGTIDMYTGYDVRYLNPNGDGELIISKNEDKFYSAIVPNPMLLGQSDQVFTQVRMRTEGDQSPWSERILCISNHQSTN